MDEHTKEPWEMVVGEECCFHDGNRVSIISTVEDADGGEPTQATIAEVWPADDDGDLADGRRIVAAMNGVKGIPTEALEAGAVAELLAAATLTVRHATAVYTSDEAKVVTSGKPMGHVSPWARAYMLALCNALTPSYGAARDALAKIGVTA